MATAEQLPATLITTPSCEIYIHNMFNFTFIPYINHRYLIVLPVSANIILIAAILSPLYYTSYYLYHPVLYSIDLSIGLIVYDYLLYLQKTWATASCFEHTQINRWNENVSLGFYSLFMLYWLYDGVIQFVNHSDNNVLIQFGNILMSTAWYIYFSVSSLLFYFICVKLEQRSTNIEIWLKSLKKKPIPIEEFYKSYKIHHSAIKKFARNWNFIIFMGFVILTYHIPIDLTNIIYNHVYTDSAGIILKSSALSWYLYNICRLNQFDNKVISYLYKHRLYSTEEMALIEKYAQYHELGLNFYGIKINGSLIIKVLLISINLILPTIYALVSNRILG
jgi:hypothetical protein